MAEWLRPGICQRTRQEEYLGGSGTPPFIAAIFLCPVDSGCNVFILICSAIDHHEFIALAVAVFGVETSYFCLGKEGSLRFQTTKRVQGQDPELVLGVLEGCLRSVSPEIVRQGSRITLLGLGPSPRAINRRDTTVIDVQREDGVTIIHADVRFQASAFLGTAAQDVVVQEKLNRIFDEMLARLGVPASSSEPNKADSAESAVPVVAEPEVAAQPIAAENPIEMAAAPEHEAAVDLITATPEETPAIIRETLGEGEDLSAASEPAEVITEPEISSAANEVESRLVSARPEPQEELPAAATPGLTSSNAAPAVAPEKPEETVSGPQAPEEEQPAGEAVTAADARLPEAKKAAEPAEADRAAKVEEAAAAREVETAPAKLEATPGKDEGTQAKLETTQTKVAPVAVEAAPVAEVIESKALPRIEAPKQEVAKPPVPAEAARMTPPSGEAAKPLPPSGAKIEAPAKFSKFAAAETRTAPGARKPEASPSSVSKSAPAAKAPAPAVLSKPVLPKATTPSGGPSMATSAGPSKGMFGVSGLEEEPETGSKLLKWSAWIAALIVLVIAPLVWLYMPSHPESASTPTPQPNASAAPSEPVASPKQPGEDPDPAVVVDDWAAAMNSRDAAAQAAFYADPVERYFLRHNLNRDQVKADKQAAIDRRKGDWAVKMESIKITRPDDKSARARLIKHYTVKEDGKTASEWFVPSVLLMTRANGRWQITSERDLGWATSLDELGY